MPDFPIEIDDSAFDSFGPLTFGLGLSISSGALEAADTAHPNGGDKDAEADITETADLLGASASGADEFLSIRTPPPPARAAEPPAPEAPVFSAHDPQPVLVPAPSATPLLAPQTPATDEDAISFQFGQLSFGGNTPAPAVGTVGGAAALADSYMPQPSSTSAQEPGLVSAPAPDQATPRPREVEEPPGAAFTEELVLDPLYKELDAALPPLDAAFSELDAAFPPLSFGAETNDSTEASREEDAHLGWQVSPVKHPVAPTPVQ